MAIKVSGTTVVDDSRNLTNIAGAAITGNTFLQQSQEKFNTKTGATGVVAHDFSTGGIFVHSSIAANFTTNVTNLTSETGRVSTVTLVLQQGATPYYSNALQIGGTAQTIKWTGGVTPTPVANATNTQVFTIFQTGASTYLVLSQVGTFS